MTPVALRGLRIGADDLAQAAEHFRAIVGVAGEWRSGALWLPLDDAALALSQVHAANEGSGALMAPRKGLWGIDLALGDAQARLAQWDRQHPHMARRGPDAAITLHGVSVFVHELEPETALGQTASAATPGAQVRLDHVALMVEDLDAATKEWADLTGLVAHRMAVHPVSKGTLSASRFLLGPRMIELLAPIAGQPSPLAARLAKFGEGPLAMALPAHDLERTLAQLREQAVGVVFSDPHWVVRPASASGVPIQLTPRVEH